ncbi:MAG: YcaO-like family protein [Methanobrevibacter sp.]|jgi:thiazole/oxazole-forming peptide maturase SagD family component|nr:YcaO-like family protein [Candidatus Methanovirga basalitermitum]
MIQSLSTFKGIYSFFKGISGDHCGMVNSKIRQTSIVDPDLNFFIMEVDFPNYGRLLDIPQAHFYAGGYGTSREDALIRLIGEIIERYSGIYNYQLLKNKIIFSSYDELIEKNVKVMDLKFLNIPDEDKIQLAINNRIHAMAMKNIKPEDLIGDINSDDVIGWFKMFDIYKSENFYVPAQLFFMGYLNDKKMLEPTNFFSISTGTASHRSYENALTSALVEYLQSDSLMLFWYAKNVKAPKVILDAETEQFLKENKLIPQDKDILVLDLTIDKPFTILGVFIIGDEYPKVSFGIHGDSNPQFALYRGLMEALSIYNANFIRSFYEDKFFELSFDKDNNFLELDSNVLYWANSLDTEKKEDFLKSKIKGEKSFESLTSLSSKKLLPSILDYLKRNNFNVGVYDITCPEVGLNNWYVLRTIIPELLPIMIPGVPYSRHPRFLKYGSCNYVLPHPLP